MDSFDEVVQARRSVRGFLKGRAVPAALIRRALELAQRSPSNCNAQPWQIYIVAGERCERLRQRLAETAARSGSAVTPKFEGVYRTRQVGCAVELYSQLGIERHDTEGRHRAMLRNFEFFGAPHVAIVCMKQAFGVGVAVDVGCWLQTFMLALQAQGIASCAQAALSAYPTVLREELGILPDLQVLCGVSFGFEDESDPANRTRQGRADIAENVVALGFEL